MNLLKSFSAESSVPKGVQITRPLELNEIQSLHDQFNNKCVDKLISIPKAVEKEFTKRIEGCKKKDKKSKLDFTKSQFSDSHLEILAELLEESPVVSKLVLVGNPITQKGAESLLRLLKSQLDDARGTSVDTLAAVTFLSDVEIQATPPAKILSMTVGEIKYYTEILAVINAKIRIRQQFVHLRVEEPIAVNAVHAFWMSLFGAPPQKVKDFFAQSAAELARAGKSSMPYTDLEKKFLYCLGEMNELPHLSERQRQELRSASSDSNGLPKNSAVSTPLATPRVIVPSSPASSTRSSKQGHQMPPYSYSPSSSLSGIDEELIAKNKRLEQEVQMLRASVGGPPPEAVYDSDADSDEADRRQMEPVVQEEVLNRGVDSDEDEEDNDGTRREKERLHLVELQHSQQKLSPINRELAVQGTHNVDDNDGDDDEILGEASEEPNEVSLAREEIKDLREENKSLRSRLRRLQSQHNKVLALVNAMEVERAEAVLALRSEASASYASAGTGDLLQNGKDVMEF